MSVMVSFERDKKRTSAAGRDWLRRMLTQPSLGHVKPARRHITVIVRRARLPR
jgi:hypothetical protein